MAQETHHITFFEYPSFLYAHRFTARRHCFTTRQYNFLEIALVTQGALNMTLDGKRHYVAPGACMVIIPGTMADLQVSRPDERHSHLSVGIRCRMESSADLSAPGASSYFRFVTPVVTHPRDPEAFTALFEALIRAYNQDNNPLTTGLYLELCGHLAQNAHNEKSRRSTIYTRKIQEYVNNNYSAHITIPVIAQYLSITPEYASTVFKAETGETIITYINRIRIQKAKDLMDRGGVSIQYVAELVGFDDQAYFSRVFRKVEGISPSEFKSALQRTFIRF